MCKLQQWLPAFLACFLSTAVSAQINTHVEISGIDGELATNVRLFLSIKQQKNQPLMTEARLRRLHNKAPHEIAQALQPFGYYKPDIKSELLQRSSDEQWLANYTIDPGPPIPLQKFDFSVSGEMKQDPEFQSFVSALPLKENTHFNHLKYESIKTKLTNLAAERGYFDSRFVEHKVVVDLDAYEVYVQLHYDSGVRYRLGEVSLQQDVLEPQFLARYVPFETGEPYTFKKLIDLQQALNDSDYFRVVEISPAEIQPDSSEVPITAKLTPRKRHRYTLGLGYGTDTGARAKFGWEMPLLNRLGHRINTEIRVSEIGYSLSAHYRVPVLNPRTDQIVYSAGVVNEETDTSESTIRTIGASLNRGRGPWRESLSLNYQQERYVVGDDRGHSTLLMPGMKWSRTWGKGFIHTLDGMRFDIGLRGANEHLISDTDFVQLQGGIKGITSVGNRNRIIARGRLGGTLTNEFQQLPSSVRFFAGGSQSVRGYAYQSLGPVNDKDKVVGGKHLMIGSIEFEHKLNGKWGVAAFYDAGNAIDDIADKLERGTGLGLRWQSPVGAVRFDLATAISRDNNPWRIHINIGPDL